MKINILNWLTGRVIFEATIPDDTEERFRVNLAVEMAVRDRARLDGASLVGASLDRARLDGASLDGARLVGARLDGASLDGASLDGARLDGASLVGARLDGGEKLIGKRPVLQFGPIGSESRYAVAYLTDRGLRFRAGCFFGDTAALRDRSERSHGKGSAHNQQYEAFIALAEAHAALWPPAVKAEARADERREMAGPCWPSAAMEG